MHVLSAAMLVVLHKFFITEFRLLCVSTVIANTHPQSLGSSLYQDSTA